MPYRFACSLLVFLTFSLAAMAQTDSGKPSEDWVRRMREMDRKMNGPKEGMILPEFIAHTADGQVATNKTLLGKVSLLIFWDPWCNCFKPDALGALTELDKERRDFQIISMMSDTGRLASYKTEHVLETSLLILPDIATMRTLNANNGIPSCVLVNREGVMVKISAHLHAGIFDEQAFTEKIQELLMF